MADVIAVVMPSAPRRAIAIGVLLCLGAMLLYLAFVTPSPSLGWQAFLLAVGISALFLADRVRRATQISIEMTDEVIQDSQGQVICRLDDIVSVESGALAFKPSGGFLIRTARPGARSWAPGLWWRIGRSIGIGGATSASQAKFMADLIAMRLKDKAAQ
ncbi:MAG: hypothetical protein ACU0DI_09590 [Paracoccaceae bacterium]